ncbi:hypothetical protein CAPTEDRAFT_220248 [Capitella teleta]|uniref:CUB domain-containing protein n=1 Tax=Capitella teleta TaxID=283909 RepID=R7TAF2_CAPTE|nr:hypothetical protein CAPTEDRAFT_220248 [Capitella teleta]|eukprot:ELT90684.1 hypothetical protein CAPTEDRAFT_220248 [Capitella teleta]
MGEECVEKCTHRGSKAVKPLVTTMMEPCLIALPDNPLIHHRRTIPCQIRIQTNCTDFCPVQLNFAKFNLSPSCTENITYHHADHCDIVDSCEYVIVHELGIDEEGIRREYVSHFHGNMTSESYISKTNRLRLSFCYRSETFSARNIQIEYKAIILPGNVPIDIGPPSVYALGCMVVVMIAAIMVILWCPWLKPCLDNTEPKEVDGYDL